ncbi:phage tail length tape measure family protein [Leclercia adecarboxylata]|uniref:phage tail length tape measure family protein n=1 Tax=Leclercia adecarboxylata TaxID=83655 RepID=UPI00254B1316|nr:phage tail length tape measure family protein [Leclercia adecarboxylata]
MSEQESRLAIRIDSTGAEKQADSLAVALDKLTQSGDKAVVSATKVTKSTEEEKVALDKLRAAIDPVGAAIDTVGRRFSELKKYFDKGLIDKEEFQFLSKKLNETTDELSGVAQAQREAEKAGKLAAVQQEAQAKAFDAMLAKIDPVVYALKNLDQQQRQIYEGAQSGRLSLEQYDSYSKKIAEMRKEVSGAAQAERDAAKAQEEQIASLARLEAKLDPVTSALKALDEQQRQIFEYTYSGALSIQQYDTYSAKIAETRRELTGEAQAERDAVKAQEEQRASLQRLLGQLDPFSAALDKIKRQRAELSAAKDAGLLTPEYHTELSNKLDLTEKGLNQVSNEMRYGAISAAQYKNAMRLLPMQFNDIATSIAGGMPLFTIFMQQGSQIADSFGGWGSLFDIIKEKLLGAGDAADDSSDSLSDNANSLSENAENAKKLTGFLSPMTIGIGALVAIVGTLAYAWYKGSQEQQEFNKSLVLTGNVVGKTTGQLSDMAKVIADSTGNSTAVAAQAINRVVSGGKIAADSMQSVTEAVVAMNDATDESIDSMVAEFEKIAQNPVAAIGELNDKYHFLTLATYNQVKALQDEGNQQDAARLATETYAAAMKQRADQIQGNLGTLEQAWKWLGDAAKGAWDAMLDIGREKSIDQKIAEASEELDRAQKSLSDLSAGQSKYAGPYGAWKSSDLSMLQKGVDAAKARLSSLQSEKTAQDVINSTFDAGNKKQQEGIKAQTYINTLTEQTLTNAQKRTREQDKLTKALEKTRAAGNSISADEEAKLRANINEKFKDPKTPKGKAYTEDAGTRMLDQLNQQYAALTSQFDTTEKIGAAQQALIKWEQQLADIKSKKTLTADQKSLLASQNEITAQLQKNAAVEKEIALRKDADKLTAFKNTLTSELQTDATTLQNDLSSNAVLSQEQKRQQELTKIVTEYQKKRVELTNQRTTGQISQNLYDQETAALQQALTQRLDMQKAYYSQLDQLNTNWQMGVQNGMQSYLNGIPTLYASTTEATTSILNSTQNSISSNLSAMVQGTESLSDGFKNMATGMGQTVIDALTKMAAQWLVYQAVQLLVGKSAAAGAASSLIGQATAMSQIAAINAYASAAAIPVIGWTLAPGAMAAAQAATVPLIAGVSAGTTAMVSGAGFMTGGYTGNGAVNSVAGVVHGKEYVFDAASTKRIGLSNLEALRNGGLLDATLGKSGYGTGAQNTDNKEQATIFSPTINMPPITINGNPSDATVMLVQQAARQGAQQGYQKVVNDLASGKGDVHKSLTTGYATKRRTG